MQGSLAVTKTGQGHPHRAAQGQKNAESNGSVDGRRGRGGEYARSLAALLKKSSRAFDPPCQARYLESRFEQADDHGSRLFYIDVDLGMFGRP